MPVGIHGTGKYIVAVLVSKVLEAAPVVLYPVQFAVELRIEKGDVSCVLYNLLQATSEIFLSWENRDCTTVTT